MIRNESYYVFYIKNVIILWGFNLHILLLIVLYLLMGLYMRNSRKKYLGYTSIIIIFGVAINIAFSNIVSALGLPLYIDSVGTMFTAVVGGIAPGMFVGFLTNLIGGFSDSSTFYYGTINVLIALIAGIAADRGFFDSVKKVFVVLGFYILLSIPCSVLTYILFDCSIGDNVSSPTVTMINKLGVPVLLSQILGDFCVEIPDKALSLFIAFGFTRLVPKKIRKDFIELSGRDVVNYNHKNYETKSSLRGQVALILFFSGLAIVIVAFLISYKTYLEAKVDGYPDGVYDMAVIRKETLLYSGKMLSAVLGLLLCIVSFSMILASRMVVLPLHKMSKEMRRFAYDSESGRDKSIEKIEALDIHTGNEIEELYVSMSKTVKEIDEYIDTTSEQAKTISKLHVDIITTLADIVESRDLTTGNHVKRTAEYCSIISYRLREKGIYAETLTDDYINILKIAAPLHDIGKIKIPDAILNKPGRLTDEEYEIMKTHPIEGLRMLEGASETMGATEYLHMAKDIAHYHHEWWDGSAKGYPERICGYDIPLSARIMAVADVFDALVSKRPYKDGFPIEKAMEIIKEESGTHFDPKIVDVFLESREELEKIISKYAE